MFGAVFKVMFDQHLEHSYVGFVSFRVLYDCIHKCLMEHVAWNSLQSFPAQARIFPQDVYDLIVALQVIISWYAWSQFLDQPSSLQNITDCVRLRWHHRGLAKDSHGLLYVAVTRVQDQDLTSAHPHLVIGGSIQCYHHGINSCIRFAGIILCCCYFYCFCHNHLINSCD